MQIADRSLNSQTPSRLAGLSSNAKEHAESDKARGADEAA